MFRVWTQNILYGHCFSCRISICRTFTSSNCHSTTLQVKENVISVLGQNYTRDEMTNATPNILAKVGRNLHQCKNHPLNILWKKIQEHVYAQYRTRWGGPMFTMVDNLSPVVTTEQNFDSLLVAKDHVTRSRNDNYYINQKYLLRAHTSAHQRDLIKTGLDAFLFAGDVYRRDEIDRSHYPVFHQLEGVRLFSQHELFQAYKVTWQGRGWKPPPHFLENYKELLRKRCFSPPPPTLRH